MGANLEYPACLLCRSDRREFPFRLQQPYSVVRCTECGLHYLYPRLVESAMQEAYRESSYYLSGWRMRIRGYQLRCPGVSRARDVQTADTNLANPA